MSLTYLGFWHTYLQSLGNSCKALPPRCTKADYVCSAIVNGYYVSTLEPPEKSTCWGNTFEVLIYFPLEL